MMGIKKPIYILVLLLICSTVSKAEGKKAKKGFKEFPLLLADLSAKVIDCPKEKCDNYEEEAAKELISDLLARESGKWLSKFLAKEVSEEVIHGFLFDELQSIIVTVGKVKTEEMIAKLNNKAEEQEIGVFELKWEDIWGIVAYCPYENRDGPYGKEDGEALIMFYSTHSLSIKQIRDKIESKPGLLTIYIQPIKYEGVRIRELSDERILNQQIKPFILLIRGTVFEKGEVNVEKYWGKTLDGPIVTFLENVPTYEDAKKNGFNFKIGSKESMATALVIDKSGSMTGDKIKKAKDAAYGYVDASSDKDVLSLVGFSTSAQSIVEPSLMSKAKEQLKQDILTVSAGGSTNIGSGLTIAHKHLSSCESKGKMALLMTDGQHNSGTYEPEVEEFVKSGWPIYTVAFGKNADQDTLRKIAEKTNGCFFPADSFNLTSIYNRINVQAHNGSIFRGYSEYIRPGKMLSYIIPVDADSNKIGFFTNWQGSRMETTLTSPSGQIVNKSNFNQSGKYREESTYTFYEIENPQVGNWQVQIVGFDVPSNGEQINFHSFSYSDISSNILAFQPAYSNNQQIQIAVKVTEMTGDRQTPLQGIKIVADIKKPSSQLKNMVRDKITRTGRTQQLRAEDLLSIYNEVSSLKKQVQLYDDGMHGDINLGDGIYANSYADTPSNGPYIVTIFLQGNTSTGKQIDRILQETFQVGPIENNTFTASEFLEIITHPPKAIDTIKQKVNENKGEATKNVINNVFDQLLKKRK
jgi:uncharacterized protein YegL